MGTQRDFELINYPTLPYLREDESISVAFNLKTTQFNPLEFFKWVLYDRQIKIATILKTFLRVVFDIILIR